MAFIYPYSYIYIIFKSIIYSYNSYVDFNHHFKKIKKNKLCASYKFNFKIILLFSRKLYGVVILLYLNTQIILS